MSLRDNLREAIQKSGLTIKEIADISTVSKRTIDKWIGIEEVEPRAKDFLKVCKAINASPTQIALEDDQGEYETYVIQELALKYRNSLNDLEDMDPLSRSTVLIQIEAVADACRQSVKKAKS